MTRIVIYARSELSNIALSRSTLSDQPTLLQLTKSLLFEYMHSNFEYFSGFHQSWSPTDDAIRSNVRKYLAFAWNWILRIANTLFVLVCPSPTLVWNRRDLYLFTLHIEWSLCCLTHTHTHTYRYIYDGIIVKFVLSYYSTTHTYERYVSLCYSMIVYSNIYIIWVKHLCIYLLLSFCIVIRFSV